MTIMAFNISAVAPSTRFLAPRPVALRAQCRRPAGRSALMIQAKTIWQLAPQDSAKNMEFIELNDEINDKKSFVSVGDKQHEDAERVFSGDAGVYVTFTSKGDANAVDSPADLFVTDEGSETEVKVNGQPIKKGEQTKLKVGSKITFGDKVYQVIRDSRAHA